MVNLVIVESPAKCKKIQGFLGVGWEVIATMGHIRALEQSIDAIGLDRDFEARYEFIKEKASAIKQLKENAKKSDKIYLASDDDREGESISYAVCILLKLNPIKTPRVVFHEITEKAIKYAIDNPRYLDMNRVNAQQCRAILDMMIGFTMSPLLWKYVASSLSAGRCQIPALRLVVDKENSIQNFKTTSSWKLTTIWKHEHITFNASMEDELDDEESAKNYMENVHQTINGKIISKEIRKWTENPPQPLITSTLQQQASALYNINPKNTMKIAQKLYEAGYITYMRTDHPIISDEAKQSATNWIVHNYGEEYSNINRIKQQEENNTEQKEQLKKKKSKKEEKNEVKAQEAHEAIRPTHIETTSIDGDWTEYDKKIYKLIWQRTIQSVMSSAYGEICKIRTQIEDDDFTWSSQWKEMIFDGWKKVGKVAELDDDKDEVDELKNDVWDNVLKLNIGDNVKWKQIIAEPKETKAQGRYTEATLVRELEKFGIGRPSTFASLISVIQEKNYVETKTIPVKEILITEYTLQPYKYPPQEKEIKRKIGGEKNKLIPTELGRTVLEFMLQHFNDLFDYKFTSHMEKRLDKVAEGNESYKDVLRDMWNSYKDRYELLIKNKEIKENNHKVRTFSNGLKAVQTKKGPLLLIENDKKEDTVFLGWISGISFEEMTQEMAVTLLHKNDDTKEIGQWNGQKIIKKSGKFGDYLQCGDIKIPYQNDEELEKIIERFENKKNGIIKEYKNYIIRSGQYGPYIIKTSLKKAQFVSVPKEIDITGLTEKDVEGIYKMGLEMKKKWNKK